MANELTITTGINLTAPAVFAQSSSIVKTLATKQFIRDIGEADTADNELPLDDVFAQLGGDPGFMLVKNVDPTQTLSVGLFVTEAGDVFVEIARLGPGEITLLKIGRNRNSEGEYAGVARIQLSGAPTLYDLTIFAK